jgi:purine-binding chemotaxis protein CheW
MMTDEMTRTILRQRAERLARPIPPTPGSDVRLLEVRRAAQFAIPVEAVRDVRPLGRLEPLPNSPAWVAGLVAWRGAPIPAIDLAAVLGTASAPAPAAPTSVEPLQIVVCGSARGDVALVVDEVRGIIDTPADSIGAIPRGAPSNAGRFALGFVPAVGLVVSVDSLVEGLADTLREGGGT